MRKENVSLPEKISSNNSYLIKATSTFSLAGKCSRSFQTLKTEYNICLYNQQVKVFYPKLLFFFP